MRVAAAPGKGTGAHGMTSHGWAVWSEWTDMVGQIQLWTIVQVLALWGDLIFMIFFWFYLPNYKNFLSSRGYCLIELVIVICVNCQIPLCYWPNTVWVWDKANYQFSFTIRPFICILGSLHTLGLKFWSTFVLYVFISFCMITILFFMKTMKLEKKKLSILETFELIK